MAMLDANVPPPKLDSGLDAEPAPDTGVAEDAAVEPDGAVGPMHDASSDAAFDATSDADSTLVLPTTLAETGLYEEGSLTQLAEGVEPFTPRYALWSDGADKQRYLLLPEGESIDTSDMDDWLFPVGTKVWKEFSQAGTKLETRLLWKNEQGWFRMAFVWNEAQTEAIAAPLGEDDVLGTEHDVPQRADCLECHAGRTDVLLGVSALQLAHSGAGVTLDSLSADGRLSDPPSQSLALPDEPAWNALGYLHSNCGSCHSPLGRAYERTDVSLWLSSSELDAIEDTVSYQSTVNVVLTDTNSDAGVRIAPQMPELSGVIVRMRTRGGELAMPPLASERVDDAGVDLISGFIEGLPDSQ